MNCSKDASQCETFSWDDEGANCIFGLGGECSQAK